MKLFIVLFSSLLSGLIGVIISNWYHKRAEKRKHKVLLLEKLLGNRNDITGKQFTEALNSVFVVYHDSKPVISALKEFHENTLNSSRETDISNQKLLELFKAMCKDVEIQPESLTDHFYLKPFNTRTPNN